MSVRAIRMGLSLAVLQVAFAAIPPGADAARWSVGASGGFNQFFAESNSFQSSGGGVPFSGPSLEFQPGIRLARDSEGGRTALFLEGGFSINDAKDAFATRSANLTLNGVWKPGTNASAGLYATAGAGVGYFRYEDRSRFGSLQSGGTGIVFGGGLGYARNLGNDHGRWRGELRYTRVGGVSDGDLTIIPKGHAVCLQLGFDLFVSE